MLPTTRAILYTVNADGVTTSRLPFSFGGNTGDAVLPSPFGVLGVVNYPMLWNGASWDRQRIPAIYKSLLTAAAGSTAVWTPAAGKKFRLMRYMIQISPDATLAVAGAFVVQLYDGATALPFLLRSYYTAAVAANAPIDKSGWVDLGNGYLSAAANNALNLNLSVALATGQAYCLAIGTEE